MANNEQLKKYIQQLVREEVRRTLPTLIGEVFGQMISEAAAVPSARKARPIREQVEQEEYPTMGGRPYNTGRMAELMGYGDMMPVGGRSQNINTLDMAMTEGGTPVPVDPNSVPEAVVKAMNRDYRDMMKQLDKFKTHG